MILNQNRKLKNFLLQPGIQIRYGLIIFSLGVIGVGYVQSMLIYSLGGIILQYAEELNSKKEIVSDLQGSINGAWIIFFVSLGFIWIFSLVLGIFITHRFIGPTVAMRELIAELKAGNYNARKQLRKNDELQDLMTDLNDLAATLQTKAAHAAATDPLAKR